MKKLLLLIPVAFVLAACEPDVVVKTQCPQLGKPPALVVQKLREAAEGNIESRNWVISLYKHYQKLGLCK